MFNEVPEKEREKKLIDGGLDITRLFNITLVNREGNAVIRRHLESLPLESFDSVSITLFGIIMPILCSNIVSSGSEYPCHNEKLAVYYDNWELLFSIFGDTWIMSGSMREMLLKVWQATPCLFWTVWKTRTKIVFKDDFLSIQKLKCLFLFLFFGRKLSCL